MHSLQLETLAKDDDTALSKIKRSGSAQQLTRELAAKIDARKRELDVLLERVGKGDSAANY